MLQYSRFPLPSLKGADSYRTLADFGTLSHVLIFQKKPKISDFNVKDFEMSRTNSNQSYF